jgi:large conductance mechanosensitive channel
MWREFREFLARGNVIGLAVAVVMGVAFGAVVSSFTDDIIMQLIAAIGAKPDFSALVVSIRDTPIRYGEFLTAVLSFVIVAAAMFLVVKAANRLWRRDEPPKASELDVLREIRDELRTLRTSTTATPRL